MKSASLTTSRPDRSTRLRVANLAALTVVALPASTGVFAPARADQTNYYRATGVSIAPTWIPSEKITLALLVSREDQSSVGSSANVQNQLARRGTSNSQSLNLTYAPLRALTFDASFVHNQRGTDEFLRAYNDGLATVGFRFMFQ